jgi:NAD(P)-dependent dehydrogenase (short-subunit alcohol dehydrogenase family)
MLNSGILSKKVAIVLGGSKGIGAQTSVQLAQHGATVCVLARNLKEIDSVIKTIHELGGKAYGYLVDVSISVDLENTLKKIQQEHGIDIVVNLVGGFTKFINFENISEQEWQQVMHLNLTTAFHVCQKVYPLINDFGRVVLIGSIAGLGPNPNAKSYLPYGVAKSGLITMVKYLAIEFGAKKVTVNCVSPGTTATQRVKDLRGEENLITLAQKNPLHHILQPEDSASTILFLVSPQAQGITGTNINVNAGSVM